MWGAQACTSGRANVAKSELLDGNRFIFRTVRCIHLSPSIVICSTRSWKDLNHVRDIQFRSFEPIIYPTMTDGLWT
jgi:hypothetical protein